MARIKADDKALNGGGGMMASLRKVMSGHSWREFLKVSNHMADILVAMVNGTGYSVEVGARQVGV